MNMVRGDDATMGERREELAGVVGPEDAMQTLSRFWLLYSRSCRSLL